MVLKRQNIRLLTRGGTEINPQARRLHPVHAGELPVPHQAAAERRQCARQVKFMFPNEHSVYMHDTPHRELFARDVRAFSNGCIRLEKPVELAAHPADRPGARSGGALRRLGRRGKTERRRRRSTGRSRCTSSIAPSGSTTPAPRATGRRLRPRRQGLRGARGRGRDIAGCAGLTLPLWRAGGRAACRDHHRRARPRARRRGGRATPRLTVTGAAEPAAAGPDQIALAMQPAFAADLAKGRARAAILWPGADWQALGLAAAILAPRPRYVLAGRRAGLRAAAGDRARHPPERRDRPDRPRSAPAPRSAPFVAIGARVRIGAGARILSHVSIAEDAVIGARRADPAAACASARGCGSATASSPSPAR